MTRPRPGIIAKNGEVIAIGLDTPAWSVITPTGILKTWGEAWTIVEGMDKDASVVTDEAAQHLRQATPEKAVSAVAGYLEGA